MASSTSPLENSFISICAKIYNAATVWKLGLVGSWNLSTLSQRLSSMERRDAMSGEAVSGEIPQLLESITCVMLFLRTAVLLLFFRQTNPNSHPYCGAELSYQINCQKVTVRSKSFTKVSLVHEFYGMSMRVVQQQQHGGAGECSTDGRDNVMNGFPLQSVESQQHDDMRAGEKIWICSHVHNIRGSKHGPSAIFRNNDQASCKHYCMYTTVLSTSPAARRISIPFFSPWLLHGPLLCSAAGGIGAFGHFGIVVLAVPSKTSPPLKRVAPSTN